MTFAEVSLIIKPLLPNIEVIQCCCRPIRTAPKWPKLVKMAKRFSGVAGRNFTELEVKVVYPFLHDKFVLQFRKSAPFLHKGCRQSGCYRKWVKICCFAPKIY